MANSVNNITVLGNLTRDPELRFTPNGNAVASFGLAVNRRTQDRQSGEWVDDVDFFNIVAWLRLAENCAESLSKGDRVLVSGRLTQDTWEDKDGQKRSAVKIIANVVAPSLEFASCKLEKNPKEDMQPKESKPSEDTDEDIDFTDDDIPF